MVSRYQLDKLAELTKEGFKVLGAADAAMGGRTLVEAPDGTKYTVGSAGNLEPAPADAQPVSPPAPPDFGED